MKKLFALLFVMPTLSWAQMVTSTELGGPSNIYNDVLKRYLISTSLNKKPIYDILFIQQDNLITDSLMADIHGSKVVVVDSSVFQEKLRQGSFVMHRLFPLSVEKGVFYVNLVPFRVTEEKGEVFLINTGTIKVEYLFDSRMRAFRFTKGKSYGY